MPAPAGPQKPSVGRMVHYVARGSADGKYKSVCRASVITEVEDQEKQVVTLTVFNPQGTSYEYKVEHQETATGGPDLIPGTWHRPEFV